MSNIFSTRTYTLESGTVLQIPRGISVTEREGRYVGVCLRKHKKLIRIERSKAHVVEMLQEAVDLLLQALLEGDLPGGYHLTKRKGTLTDDLPPGVTMRHVKTTGEYRLYISYPDVATERLKQTNYYVGSEATYLTNFDIVTKRGIRFRNEQLALYRIEFMHRLLLLKEQLINENNQSQIAA